MNKDILTQRKALGFMGIILPWALLLCDIIFGRGQFGTEVIPSISAHHYAPSYLLFEGVVFAMGCFLLAYNGYDIRDKWIARVAGAGGLALALFPCSLPYTKDYVHNFAMLPQSVTNVVHLVGAATLFGLMSVMMVWQFTKTSDKLPSKRKLLRNKFYVGCGILMIASLAVGFCLGHFFPASPAVFIGELIALHAFGIGWLIKGETLLKDDPEKK